MISFITKSYYYNNLKESSPKAPNFIKRSNYPTDMNQSSKNKIPLCNRSSYRGSLSNNSSNDFFYDNWIDKISFRIFIYSGKIKLIETLEHTKDCEVI